MTRALAVALALALAPGSARGQPEGPVREDSVEVAAVLVWPLAARGVRGEQALAVLRSALAAGLERAQLPAIDAGEVEPCAEVDCRVAAAAARGAAYVAVPTVAVVNRDYSFRIDLIEVASGRSQTLAEACPICGLEEASTILESLGPRLRLMWETALGEERARLLRDEQERRVREQEQALAKQPRLRVTSDPKGSPVWIDGEEVGKTPLEYLVTEGKHVVEIRRLGFARERREVILSRGTSSELPFRLRPLGRAAPTRRSQSLLIAGSVLGGAGLLGFGLMTIGLVGGARAEREGAALREDLLKDGKTGLEITDGLVDVRNLGIAMNAISYVGAVMGGVLTLSGAVLIGVSTTKAARRVSLRPWGAPASAGLVFGGRF